MPVKSIRKLSALQVDILQKQLNQFLPQYVFSFKDSMPTETYPFRLGSGRVTTVSLSEREEFRSRAAQLGAGSEVHFTDVPEEELLTRLAARNADLPPGTFHIEESQLRLWSTLFEPPTQDELQPKPRTPRCYRP